MTIKQRDMILKLITEVQNELVNKHNLTADNTEMHRKLNWCWEVVNKQKGSGAETAPPKGADNKREGK